jgi:hypothetical protein
VIEHGDLRIALAVIFSVNVNFHARRTGNLRDAMGQSNVESRKALNECVGKQSVGRTELKSLAACG